MLPMQDTGEPAIGCDPQGARRSGSQSRPSDAGPSARAAACPHNQVDGATGDYGLQVGGILMKSGKVVAAPVPLPHSRRCSPLELPILNTLAGHQTIGWGSSEGHGDHKERRYSFGS
jgi:hypothetical protein